MATFVLPPDGRYAIGSTVEVYLAAATDGVRHPSGALITSAVVAANGTTTFTGLADGTNYVAWQTGKPTFFSTPFPQTSFGGLPQAEADALDAALDPSATNPFVTESDPAVQDVPHVLNVANVQYAGGAKQDGTNIIPAMKAAVAAAKVERDLLGVKPTIQLHGTQFVVDLLHHMPILAGQTVTPPLICSAKVHTQVTNGSSTIVVDTVTGGTVPLTGGYVGFADTNEVVQYASAVDNGDGTFTLSGLTRNYVNPPNSVGQSHSVGVAVSFTSPVSVTCDTTINDPSHYPSGSGVAALQEPGINRVVVLLPTGNFRYTSRSGGVFSSCVFDQGFGQTYDQECCVLDPAVDQAPNGTDEAVRIAIDCEGCDHITFDLRGLFLVKTMRMYLAQNGDGTGPIFLGRRIQPSAAGPVYPLTAAIRRTRREQFFDVGYAVQPNPLDGSRTGNLIAPGQSLRIASNRFNGYDRGSMHGYTAEVAAEQQWATHLDPGNSGAPTTVIIHSTDTASISSKLNVPIRGDARWRSAPDPGGQFTTLAAPLNAGDTTITLADHSAIGFMESGWLAVDNDPTTPTGFELIKVEGYVDPSTAGFTNTVLAAPLRGQGATTGDASSQASTHASGCKVRRVEVGVIGQGANRELVVYDDITLATLTIIKRGLSTASGPGVAPAASGTPVIDHTVGDYFYPGPCPGRVWSREPIEGGPYGRLEGRSQRAVTSQALAGTETYPFTLDLKDSHELDAYGVIEFANGMQLSYGYNRGDGRLYNCRIGVNGTAAGAQSSGATVRQVQPTCKVVGTTGNTTAGTNITVNGADAFRRGFATYVAIHSDGGPFEIANPSALSNSTVGTVSGDIPDAASTSFTLQAGNSIAVDSSGFAVFTVENELIRAQISGNNVTNAERGYWGSTPTSHLGNKSVKQLKTMNCNAVGARGARGTVAQTHAADSVVWEVDAAYAQPITPLDDFHIRGHYRILGENTSALSTPPTPFVPKVRANGAGFTSSHGNRQIGMWFDGLRDGSIEGFTIEATENIGIAFRDCLRSHIHHGAFKGIDRWGWGYSAYFIGATRDCTAHDYTVKRARQLFQCGAGGGAYGTQRQNRVYNFIGDDFLNHGIEIQNAAEDIFITDGMLRTCSAGGVWSSIGTTHTHNVTVIGPQAGGGIVHANMSDHRLAATSSCDRIIECVGSDPAFRVFVDAGATSGVNNLAGALLWDFLEVTDLLIVRPEDDGIGIHGEATGGAGTNGEVSPGYRFGSLRIQATVDGQASTQFSGSFAAMISRVAGLDAELKIDKWLQSSTDAVQVTDCDEPSILLKLNGRGTGTGHGLHLMGATHDATILGRVKHWDQGNPVFMDDSVTNSKVLPGFDCSLCALGIHLGAGAGNATRPTLAVPQALTYGATVNTDGSKGQNFKLTVTDGNALTIANPTNPFQGGDLSYDILNSSGGAMGAITWGAQFKLAGAFTNPANGKRRTIAFYWDGSNWVEKFRAAADI